MLAGVGAIVMGPKGFDKNEGDGRWGDSGPVGDTHASLSPTTSRPRGTHPCRPSSPTASSARLSRPRARRATSSSPRRDHLQQALPLGPCLEGSIRRSPSNAPMCWLPCLDAPGISGWSGKPLPDATRPHSATTAGRDATLRPMSAGVSNQNGFSDHSQSPRRSLNSTSSAPYTGRATGPSVGRFLP
jgi:hypothetical protein